MKKHIDYYADKLSTALRSEVMSMVPVLGMALRDAWKSGRSIYLCGNGGSAGNAIHLANDLLYGVGIRKGIGMRVEALSANAAVITCLANDIGYDKIYSEQLRVKANAGDILIALSGSGNSPNIIKAIEMGNSMRMKTFAITGYTGGKCLALAQISLHFDIDDMQIAEDLQLIVGHMCMQWLCSNPTSDETN